MKKLWLYFGIIVVILSVATSIATSVVLGGMSWVSGPTFAIVVAMITIALAWTQVPESYKWNVELYGEFMDTWGPGLHFRFPYFGFMRINSKVYMGEQQMLLYMDESVKEGYGKGTVDFADASAPIIAFVYFKIVDAYKAAYAIADIFRGIEEKMDSLIRSYLASFKIGDANKLKPHFNLEKILYNHKPDENKKFPPQPTNEEVAAKDAFLDWMKEQWGAEITAIVISDIVLSPEVIEIRTRVMMAEKVKEAAKEEAKTLLIKAEAGKKAKIKEAEGEKTALELVGAGMAEQINSLKAVGLYPVEAAQNIVEQKKWGKGIGNSAVIIEGGSEIPGFGAKFGAGKDAFNRTRHPGQAAGEEQKK